MRSFPLFLAGVVLAFATAARSQCALDWTSGGPQNDLTGLSLGSTTWDPDGAGPLPQRLVIGGSSLAAGHAMGQRVMTWDGTQWEALGPGPGSAGDVRALVVWNGTLIAGGSFLGGGTDRIAQWDGSAWQALGAAFPTTVYSLAVWNGQLVAAGYTTLSGLNTPVIRTWDGTAWTALPLPPLLDVPLALASYQGLLCVGGRTNANLGVLERWNGTAWSNSITAGNWITTLAVRHSQIIGGTDTLFVGGFFQSIGSTPTVLANHIASTSGGSTFAWSAVAGGLPSGCHSLHVRNSSAASFVLTALLNSSINTIQQLTGPQVNPSWVPMGSFPHVHWVNHYAGSYHAATTSGACLRYNGIQFVTVKGPGIDDDVRAATAMGNDIVVGGRFSTIAGTAASGIARWDGSSFQPLGSGMTGQVTGPVRVASLLTLANGDVVAGGLFVFAGTMNANSIARWNGSAWSTFGAGMNQEVLALCEMPNGDIVAGGWFTQADGLPCVRIGRWDGSQWQPFGSGANASVQALAVRQDGMLFAAGSFSTIDGVACNRIAQWNGTSWAPLGTGCNGVVFDLAVRPNGDVVAVGSFTTAGGVAADRCARWTGSSWVAMGTSSIDPGVPHAVLALPNGDVVVGHGFHTPAQEPDEGLSRWNGSAWSAIGTVVGPATDEVEVWCLAQRSNGELVIGGDFRLADGVISRNLAAVQSTCMPLVDSGGFPCAGPAGPVVITADALPWTGATFRTTTTGIVPGALCLGVIGLSTISVPLDLVFAEGVPQCRVYAAPDILLLLSNGPGTAHSQFALANDPSLLSVTFFQQTIPLEFDAFGALDVVRSSNRLDVTIGTL